MQCGTPRPCEYSGGQRSGQQRFLKTLDIRHGEILADTDAGLAPDEAERVRAAAC